MWPSTPLQLALESQQSAVVLQLSLPFAMQPNPADVKGPMTTTTTIDIVVSQVREVTKQWRSDSGKLTDIGWARPIP